jgi:hypothetical protein
VDMSHVTESDLFVYLSPGGYPECWKSWILGGECHYGTAKAICQAKKCFGVSSYLGVFRVQVT